jgi:rubrerythrin
MTPEDRSAGDRGAQTGDPLGHPLFSEPGDEARTIGDEGLLEILEAAIADERAAQEKYRRGHDRCADLQACAMFETLLRDEEAHERALLARYTEVKKRLGLSGAGRRDG